MFTDMTKILDKINNDHMFFSYKEFPPPPKNDLKYEKTLDGGFYILKYMLPGVNKTDLNITISSNDEGRDILKIEISNAHLNVNRSKFKYKLPRKLDVDNIDTGYSNGLLTLIFTKKQDKQLEEKTINI